MTAEMFVLLADDDKDDRFFFNKALKESSFLHHLSTVENGEMLMDFLYEHSENLPDVIFLDLNMPRKNGSECLVEIKSSKNLKNIPVIIYSTAMQPEAANVFYNKGAHYYLQKCNFEELKKKLAKVFLMLEKSVDRPPKDKFIVTCN